MYSPFSVNYSVFRNRGYDGKESIISLDEFLTLAKGNPTVGVYIDLQVINTMTSNRVTSFASELLTLL